MKKLILTISFILAQPAQAASFSDACESKESWKIELQQKSNWVNRFNVFLTGQESPWLAFSEAIQLKKISNLMKNGEFEADLSEYWVGRIFYNLELYPLAYTFFNSSAENSRFPEIKNASSACLKQIYKKLPDWNPLIGTGIFIENELLRKAVSEQKKRDYPASIKSLNEFLVASTPLGIANRSEYRDLAHLLLGRAYYSMGKFSDSINAFQKVDKKSNVQIDAMNDMAWAYLLSERYAEALGIALQLRSGALKSTFCPESLMIAAMALNETCSYPDAVRMIQSFIQDYDQPFKWLLEDHSKDNLYQEVILGLKNQSKVPMKIRSEWTKSSAFLVRQAEINMLIENSRKISGMPAKIRAFQKDLAMKNVKLLKKLNHDLRVASLKKTVDPELAQRLLSAKKEIRRMIRFNQAGKIMQIALKKFDATIPGEKAKLVKKVNKDLSSRNKELLSLLKRVRENIDLVEIEVYNGASRDLAKLESNVKKEAAQAPKFENAMSWSWGRFSAADIEREEIWEDEMGAMKANIVNHCQN